MDKYINNDGRIIDRDMNYEKAKEVLWNAVEYAEHFTLTKEEGDRLHQAMYLLVSLANPSLRHLSEYHNVVFDYLRECYLHGKDSMEANAYLEMIRYNAEHAIGQYNQYALALYYMKESGIVE